MKNPCNKVRLKTKRQALKHLEQVKVLNAANGKEHRNRRLHVYLCACGWWHVGHEPREDNDGTKPA